MLWLSMVSLNLYVCVFFFCFFLHTKKTMIMTIKMFVCITIVGDKIVNVSDKFICQLYVCMWQLVWTNLTADVDLIIVSDKFDSVHVCLTSKFCVIQFCQLWNSIKLMAFFWQNWWPILCVYMTIILNKSDSWCGPLWQLFQTSLTVCTCLFDNKNLCDPNLSTDVEFHSIAYIPKVL